MGSLGGVEVSNTFFGLWEAVLRLQTKALAGFDQWLLR